MLIILVSMIYGQFKFFVRIEIYFLINLLNKLAIELKHIYQLPEEETYVFGKKSDQII